jgi:hypothetical protein
MLYLGGQRGYFQKLSYVSETLDMTSAGLGEMFEGDSSDIFAEKFPLMLMGVERRVSCPQTRELGPPSAWAEILFDTFSLSFNIFENTVLL